MHSPLSEDVTRLEEEIARLKAALANLRRAAPRSIVPDCTFHRPDASPVRLSELFAGKPDLLVIHNMGHACPYCTVAADGFNGLADHLQSRTGFVLVSPDPPDALARFARARGWRFPVASAAGSSFTRDVGFEPEPGKCWPGASGFHRDADGTMTRVASAVFGPGDSFCGLWHLFDLLADGANGWQPRFAY